MAIFAEIVEANSFSAAARRLGISKSAVSKAIAALEARLGVRLLHRTTRRLRMTEEGELFYESSVRVVAEALRAEELLGTLRESPRGLLRINAPITLGRRFVIPAIVEFRRRHPQVAFDVALQDDYVDLIGTSTDVAVRVGRLADSSLVARRLTGVRVPLVAAPAYLEGRGTPTHPDELVQHDFLRYSMLSNPDRLVLVRDEERHQVRLAGPLLSNSGDAIRDLAVAGLGIGALPYFTIAEDLASGRLLEVLEGYTLPEVTAYAVYPHGRLLTAKLRLFLDLLAERANDITLCGRCPAP